MEVLLVEI